MAGNAHSGRVGATAWLPPAIHQPQVGGQAAPLPQAGGHERPPVPPQEGHLRDRVARACATRSQMGALRGRGSAGARG
eukprot:1150451-Alexandrium_andersonii.AAC.1